MIQRRVGRRDFFAKVAGLAGAAWALPRDATSRAASLSNPVGYATLTWPDSDLPHALDVISSRGFKGVQLLGWVSDEYGDKRFAVLQSLLKKLKLEPVALSCHGVKLHPGEKSPDLEKMRGYVEFFKGLGGHYLQVTDGGRPNVNYAATDIWDLGQHMNQLGMIAADAGLTLGYHPHFGTIGESRQGLGRVLDATDPERVKLGGSDPAEVIRTYRDRLLFFHFKDVRKDVWELAQKDRNLVRHAPCHFSEVGAGTVKFEPIISAIQAAKFEGWIIVELDPCKELAGGPDGAAERNQAAMRKLGFAV